jgi:hypothetical protein
VVQQEINQLETEQEGVKLAMAGYLKELGYANN